MHKHFSTCVRDTTLVTPGLVELGNRPLLATSDGHMSIMITCQQLIRVRKICTQFNRGQADAGKKILRATYFPGFKCGLKRTLAQRNHDCVKPRVRGITHAQSKARSFSLLTMLNCTGSYRRYVRQGSRRERQAKRCVPAQNQALHGNTH